jgi:hypothetical protein
MSKAIMTDEVEAMSVTDNGILYEAVFDLQNHKTSFYAISKDGTVNGYYDKAYRGTRKFIPVRPSSHLLTKEIVLLPSQPLQYNSEIELIEKIKKFIHKYLEITPEFESIATYYVILTWMYDKFDSLPYLRAIGDYGSGKSRFLRTIGSICYHPMFTSGATTTSPIFRLLDEVKGTLILDEADLKSTDMSTDIVKILNQGYQKGTPVMRSEGKGVFHIKSFDVYGPKLVGTREVFDDKALESRFLVEHMISYRIRDDIPKELTEEFKSESVEIRNNLLAFRLKNYFTELVRDTTSIKDIHPRLNQILLPLLTLIKDEEVRLKLIEFVKKYDEQLVEERKQTYEGEIILCICKFIESNSDSGEVSIKWVTNEFNKQFEGPKEFFTPAKIGWYLRRKLHFKTIRKSDGYILNLKDQIRNFEMWKERFGITKEDVCDESVLFMKEMSSVDPDNYQEKKSDLPF